MNCNYTISTTIEAYFKTMNFVDVCAVRSGNTTRYYFNDYAGDTKELVVDSNNLYSINNVTNQSFNGVYYQYRDWGTVMLIIIGFISLIYFLDKILNFVFGIGKGV